MIRRKFCASEVHRYRTWRWTKYRRITRCSEKKHNTASKHTGWPQTQKTSERLRNILNRTCLQF